MSKELALIHYRTTMTIFQKLVDSGILTKEELIDIDTVIGEKYGLSSFSIYRITLDSMVV